MFMSFVEDALVLLIRQFNNSILLNMLPLLVIPDLKTKFSVSEIRLVNFSLLLSTALLVALATLLTLKMI